MTVESLRMIKQGELVLQYAKAIARAINRRGLRKGPYSRELITSSIVRDGSGYRFSVWGSKMRNMGIWVDENSMKTRTVQVSEFFNSPRRTVPVSKLLASSEEIFDTLWPNYQEIVYADAVGMVS